MFHLSSLLFGLQHAVELLCAAAVVSDKDMSPVWSGAVSVQLM